MTAADQIVRSAKKCLPWGRPHMTRTTQPHGAQPDRHHIAIEDRRKTILGKQRDLFGLPGAFIEDLDRLAPRGFLIVVDLSKIQYLPLNHAAIMNAPIFDNRPCPMVLAVLAANLGAQKHDADSRFDHGPARHLVGTTGVCADLEACRTGMAKGVPALVGGLDSEGDKSTIGDIVDAPRLHRPTGCLHAEEDFRAG